MQAVDRAHSMQDLVLFVAIKLLKRGLSLLGKGFWGDQKSSVIFRESIIQLWSLFWDAAVAQTGMYSFQDHHISFFFFWLGVLFREVCLAVVKSTPKVIFRSRLGLPVFLDFPFVLHAQKLLPLHLRPHKRILDLRHPLLLHLISRLQFFSLSSHFPRRLNELRTHALLLIVVPEDPAAVHADPA